MEERCCCLRMGGETLSWAAAKATRDKLEREPVAKALAARGQAALDGTAKLLREAGLAQFIAVSGHPSWGFLTFADAGGYSSFEIKTLFLQEMFARGILTLGTHNLSYAHSDADIERLMVAYGKVFPLLAGAILNKALKQYLRCEPLQPLFKVRST